MIPNQNIRPVSQPHFRTNVHFAPPNFHYQQPPVNTRQQPFINPQQRRNIVHSNSNGPKFINMHMVKNQAPRSMSPPPIMNAHPPHYNQNQLVSFQRLPLNMENVKKKGVQIMRMVRPAQEQRNFNQANNVFHANSNQLSIETSGYVLMDKNMRMIEKDQQQVKDSIKQRYQSAKSIKDEVVMKESFSVIESMEELIERLKQSERQNNELKARIKYLESSQQQIRKKGLSNRQEELLIRVKQAEIKLQKMANQNQMYKMTQVELEKKLKKVKLQSKEQSKQLQKLKYQLGQQNIFNLNLKN